VGTQKFYHSPSDRRMARQRHPQTERLESRKGPAGLVHLDRHLGSLAQFMENSLILFLTSTSRLLKISNNATTAFRCSRGRLLGRWASRGGVKTLGGKGERMAIIHWKIATSGDFNTASNWNPAVVPGSGDDAIIDAVGTYTVTSSTTNTGVSRHWGSRRFRQPQVQVGGRLK
jgi:hypothetical protein